MTLRWIRVVVAVALVAGAALVGAESAGAQATTEIVFAESEVEVSGEDVCSGDEILLTGESRGLIRITETPSGGITVNLEAFVLLKGFGVPSGQSYVMPLGGSATIALVGQDASTFVVTQVVNTQVITRGGDNDLYGHAIVHLTVVDGRVTAEVEDVKVYCK